MEVSATPKSSKFHQPVTTVSYEWEIVNFAAGRQVMANFVDSPKFPEGQQRQWYCRVYPVTKKNGEAPPRNQGVYLALEKAEVGCNSVSAAYKLTFLDDKGRVKKAYSSAKEDFIPGGKQWGWSEADFAPFVTESGALRMQWEVTTASEPPAASLKASQLFWIPESTLTADISKVDWFSPMFCIESSDSSRICHVHKDLLVVRIPNFFAPLVESKMAENEKNQVKVEFDADVVASLIHFVYYDAVSHLGTVASRLLAVAHQYQIERLIALCAAELADQLTIDNLAETIRTAKLFDLPQLKSACDSFIRRLDQDELLNMFEADADGNDSHLPTKKPRL